MMNAESVKARLRNEAIRSGKTFQEMLTYYGLERAIYRISISPYADHFVLKGGIFLYAIFDRNYERATTDIDFLARRISNSAEEIREVFREIFSVSSDDAVFFDPDTIKVENITELMEYHGLRVSVTGYLGRTRIPISIDIGFGDVIYPEDIDMDFPVILDMPVPKVKSYSLESTIAEKLEAMIRLGYLNSRYKDFYDVYVLSRHHDFHFEPLKEAVMETFSHRGTMVTMDSIIFQDEFLNDRLHQTRWKNFLKKKKALLPLSLNDVMAGIKAFVKPLMSDSNNIKVWNPERGKWE